MLRLVAGDGGRGKRVEVLIMKARMVNMVAGVQKMEEGGGREGSYWTGTCTIV